ncbi:helix-turn-helix domain-containing protein [Budvicia diplopodorum]|uniref:helix-turn-helix domain-containing protein n=1 Tax=Budvicia diplopodorum TaxID=1119056 RepID=UPI00135A792F|nr:helix-turn-helix domain-containing protein [Budvicia diplopodorum]
MLDNIKLMKLKAEKPLESIWRIVNALTGKGTKHLEHEEFIFNHYNERNESEHYVYVVSSGSIQLYQGEGGLLVGVSDAPLVLGLLKSKYTFNAYTFELDSNSVIERIPYETAISIIKHDDLLDDLLAYLAFISDCHTYRETVFIQDSTYKVLCLLLMELSYKPLEERLKISVIAYIMKRSSMSRSGALRMLSALREGGYIDMQKGKLINVCKLFPDNF